MGFTVTLKVNSSPVEKIGKTLTVGTDYTCRLKENTSILRPTIILLSVTDPTGFNYMYISEFGRYYFIDDIVSVNNNIWEISGHVDVLETYGTAIKANSAVIKRQEKVFNLYLDDPEFKVYNNTRVQCKRFNGGGNFSKTLTYVLVTCGTGT